ncbi:MAG: hypothetical protein RR759_08270 [Ruthenibacterium sp.]
MHYYTSVNLNYFAKARVLAKSVKAHNPDAYFSCVLYDDIPPEIKIEDEPFDEIVTVADLHLPMENVNLWLYQHNTVELGTAIKGQALLDFLQRSDKVAYIDPDIVVYDNLHALEELLDTYSCVVTPHQLEPETDAVAIEGNEMGSMLRGTYNFGFYAANNSESGIKFATWFRDRLLTHCFDDVPNGLFTDQRWGNLAPAMFDNVCIWRHPGCNVSTWNLTHRHVTKTADGKYFVNGEPLLFYHFSGFDSGAQLEMLKMFGKGNPVLLDMRNWYIEQQKEAGQELYQNWKSKYNYYTDGSKIEQDERTLLRHSEFLQKTFAKNNPYDKKDGQPSYYEWYVANHAQWVETDEKSIKSDHERVIALTAELERIYNSRSWKMMKPFWKISHWFKSEKS